MYAESSFRARSTPSYALCIGFLSPPPSLWAETYFYLQNSKPRQGKKLAQGRSGSWESPHRKLKHQWFSPPSKRAQGSDGACGPFRPAFTVVSLLEVALLKRVVEAPQRCCSVVQSCPSLCNPMDYSTPGLPVLHHLPEFTQNHVHWVGDAIQPSHPLSSPSPPAPQSFPASGSVPMSQLFASGGQSIGVSASESVLPMNTQDWFSLGSACWISLQSKGLRYAIIKIRAYYHSRNLVPRMI